MAPDRAEDPADAEEAPGSWQATHSTLTTAVAPMRCARRSRPLWSVHQNHELLSAGDARVDLVALKHGAVLGQDRNDDGGVFGARGFVNRRRVGRHQGIQFAEAIGHSAAVEAGCQFTEVGVDVVDVPTPWLCRKTMISPPNLLLRPSSGDAPGANGADASHLTQPLRCAFDDIEHLLAEGLDHLLGVNRPNAPDHAGGEVLLDALK